MCAFVLSANGVGLCYGGLSCFKLDEIKMLYPTHRWVFLTLTVRNCDLVDLKDTLKHMNASWQRMIQTVAFKNGIAGFIRTTEVTRGKDGDMRAHPHYHALLLVKPSYFAKNYIKQSDWVEMWQKSLSRLCPKRERQDGEAVFRWSVRQSDL